MAHSIALAQTSLSGEEVIVRSIQFFATEKFRSGSQSGRVAAFDGKPPLPWGMMLLTVLGFIFCIVPGIIMYVMVLQKYWRFDSLVVTANPIPGGTEVSISHPQWAAAIVRRFVGALPPFALETVPAPQRLPPPLPPQ